MKRLISLCLIFCMVLSGCGLTTATVPENSDGLTVHFIDVGQADSILLQCDGANMLIDGGNREDSDLVVSYLQDQGVEKLDYVVNTHAHEDHVGGLPAVLAVYETTNLWCPVTSYNSRIFEKFCYYADQQDLELVCPEPGSTYPLGSATITVLGPVKEYEETNNTSIILSVDYGETSFLFTGDAEREAETDVLDAGTDVKADVLKLGHHGSNTSTTYRWLREVDPEYAIVSCGVDNSYGHPHEEVMSRLRDAEVEVYRTDMQGHIVCHSDGKNLTFTTQKHADVTNPLEKTSYFVGNIKSKKVHRPTCSGLPEESNQVIFDTYEEAVSQGYTPCGRCIG